VADRGVESGGAEVRRNGRDDEQDAAVPDQTAPAYAATTEVPDDDSDLRRKLARQALKESSVQGVGPWM